MRVSDTKAKQKCRIGQGALCCSFLSFSVDGWRCEFMVRGEIFDALFRRQTKREMNALAGPCANPIDDFSPPKVNSNDV
jgi:hypothetical protein